MPPARCAAAYRRGSAITQDAAAIVTASGSGSRGALRASSTCLARRCTSTDGMSIFTGQAS